MDRRTSRLVALAAGAAAVVAWRVWTMRTTEPEPTAEPMRQPRVDPVTDVSTNRSTDAPARTGTQADRGSTESVRLDLARAKATGLKPVVEFLTFLQQTRGDGSHLLFVRYDDLDGLAEAEGVSAAEFLTRLDQLGVVVSTN